MKKLVLGIDMDNTITDFTFQFIKYVKKEGYELNKNLYTQWHLERCIIGLNEKEQDELTDYVCSKDDFWLTMSYFKYAPEYIEWLNIKNEVYIVTTPWKFEDKFFNSKLLWLNQHLPFIKINQVLIKKNGNYL